METTRNKINQVREIHRNNLFVCGALMFMSWVFLLSPVFSKNLSKKTKEIYLVFGILASISQVLMSENSKKNAGLMKAYEKYELQGLSNELSSNQRIDNVIDEITTNEKLAQIVESLPEYKRARYIQEYNLFGLIKPPTQGQILDAQVIDESVVKVKKALPTFNPDVEKVLDISWMNHDFFFKGGSVLGAAGKGKTGILQLIAANILSISEDVDLKIHTVHYNPKKERWFPNMPEDVEKSLFIKDPQLMFQDIQNVNAEMIRREEEDDYDCYPVVRIVDEQMAIKDRLGDDDWGVFMNILIQLQNRGRKLGRKIDDNDTGFTTWLGMHCAKKGQSGVDSNYFTKGAFLILGKNMITDNNVPYPADFDRKKLAQEMNACGAMLQGMGLYDPANSKKDKARPIIVRLDEQSPVIMTMPRVDLSAIKYVTDESNGTTGSDVDNTTQITSSFRAKNCPGDVWTDKLSTWFRGKKGNITDEELLEEVFDLIGKRLTPELLAKLKEIL